MPRPNGCSKLLGGEESRHARRRGQFEHASFSRQRARKGGAGVTGRVFDFCISMSTFADREVYGSPGVVFGGAASSPGAVVRVAQDHVLQVTGILRWCSTSAERADLCRVDDQHLDSHPAATETAQRLRSHAHNEYRA